MSDIEFINTQISNADTQNVQMMGRMVRMEEQPPVQKKILRVRAHVNLEDYRPVVWPVKYPYWCSSENDTHSIIITYVENLEALYIGWPEAINVESEEVTEVVFTPRFQQPDWFDVSTCDVPVITKE